MQSLTANEAKTLFGEFLDKAQREPVRVMRHGRVVGVMVSASLVKTGAPAETRQPPRPGTMRL